MKIPANYLEVNQAAWNRRTTEHVKSDFYDVEGFLAGNEILNDIELELLKDIKGKKVLHLQCHFGLDSLALVRMGAEVTGVDFSKESIAHANKIAERAALKARFIHSDIFKLPELLDEKFDIIFSSYGVIGWHPDLKAWASLINQYLKPGGRLVFAEFHPVVWIFDNDFKGIQYSYFNRESIIETETQSYASGENVFNQKNITWNHDLAEVFQSLLSQNLRISSFSEYDYSPYNCFNNTVQTADKRWQITGLEGRIPMVYSLTAVKD